MLVHMLCHRNQPGGCGLALTDLRLLHHASCTRSSSGYRYYFSTSRRCTAVRCVQQMTRIASAICNSPVFGNWQQHCFFLCLLQLRRCSVTVNDRSRSHVALLLAAYLNYCFSGVLSIFGRCKESDRAYPVASVNAPFCVLKINA